MNFGIGNAVIIIGIVIALIGIIITTIWLSTDVTSDFYNKIVKFSSLGFVLVYIGGITIVAGGIIGTGDKETRILRKYYRLKEDVGKSQNALEMFLLKHPEIKISDSEGEVEWKSGF